MVGTVKQKMNGYKNMMKFQKLTIGMKLKKGITLFVISEHDKNYSLEN